MRSCKAASAALPSFRFCTRVRMYSVLIGRIHVDVDVDFSRGVFQPKRWPGNQRRPALVGPPSCPPVPPGWCNTESGVSATTCLA